MASASESRTVFDEELAYVLCTLEIPKRIKFSPDGKHVVYATSLQSSKLRKDKHRVSTLWLASTTEPGSARQLSSGLFNDTQPTWHPDGKQVAFLSDRGNPGKGQAIWILRLDGGDALQISPASNEAGIATFAFSPDGGTIAYISADEKTKERKEREDKGMPDPEIWGQGLDYARLRLVDLRNKVTKTLVSHNRHVVNLSWSLDGKKIVFGSCENLDIEELFITGTTISTVAIGSGEIADLYTVQNGLTDLTSAPDGTIYFITGEDGSNMTGTAVYAFNPAGVSPNLVKVASGEHDDTDSLVIMRDKLIVKRNIRLGSLISDLSGQELFKRSTELTAWDVFFDPESSSWVLAAGLSDTNSPFEVFIVKDGQHDVQLSEHGKELKNRSFGSFNVINCQSSDGEVELDGLYITPSSKVGHDGAPKVPLPTMVLIHGGPNFRNFESFDSNFLYWTPYLLSKGYGVLLPQYRGSYGRGKTFAAYSVTGHGRDNYADIITITDTAIKQGFANSEKLLVGGWSNGGLLTYLCSVRNGLHGLGWRFNAAIAGAGICDMDSLSLTSDIGSTALAEVNNWLTPWTSTKDDTRGRRGSALWEVAGAVDKSQRSGEMVIPPMLILHGDRDNRAPFTQSQGFRRALRTHNLPCEFVAYPGQGHTLEPLTHWVDMLERVSRWCDVYIGPGTES